MSKLMMLMGLMAGGETEGAGEGEAREATEEGEGEGEDIPRDLLPGGDEVEKEDAKEEEEDDEDDGEPLTWNDFHGALEKQKLKRAQRYIDQSARPDKQMLTEELFIAVQGNRVRSARFLLGHGADINAVNNKGETPIFYAVANGKIPMIRLLCGNTADLAHYNNDGEFPLLHAFKNKKLEVADYLIENGASIEQKHKFNGRTSLHWCAANTDIEGAQILLNFFANTEERDNKGNTVLLVACAEGQPEMVKYFSGLEYADKKAVNYEDKDARMLAKANPQVAQALSSIGVFDD